MPPNEPPNDQNLSLSATARAAFEAYNAGGPPERASLTWDGKPVPAFDAVGDVVRHKWSAAASTAALVGAAYVIELVRAGQHDPRRLEAAVREVLSAPAWTPPAPPPDTTAPEAAPAPVSPGKG